MFIPMLGIYAMDNSMIAHSGLTVLISKATKIVFATTALVTIRATPTVLFLKYV